MASRQAFAFQQVGHQIAHQRQVAQQGFAAGLQLFGFGQQFGVQAGAGERAAQFMADGQQQAAFGVQHLLDVGGHGVDGAGQLAQLIGMVRMRHGNRLGKVPRAKAQCAGTDVVQRAQQATHAAVGQRGKQQQQRQRGPADKARPVIPGSRTQGELDAVAVGSFAFEQMLFLAPAVAVAQMLRKVRQIRVAAPVHQRAADADAQGQPLHQRLCPLHAGRAADLGGQLVHIVHYQWARRAAPADAERVLHAAHKHGGHGQRQQHKQRHQAHTQRMRQGMAGAAVPGRTASRAASCGARWSGVALRSAHIGALLTARV